VTAAASRAFAAGAQSDAGPPGDHAMTARTLRVVVATVACLLWLNGCESSTRLGDMFQSNTAATQGASQDDPAITGSLPPKPREGTSAAAAPPSSDPNDDVSLGTKYFRAGNFGLAERHFRRAVELHPRDVESWIGLAASYDRQRRFDLADRAYDQAAKIVGPTAEILNNRGYSYMLRGDQRRARETLLEAQARDPGNAYIKNNLELLEASLHKGKSGQ
jgi:tetratricopeptide (TPR) repeat protein